MPTFTPPSLPLDSPYFPNGNEGDPLGNRLMRFYQPRQRGVAVFKMSDGSYVIQYAGTPVVGPQTYEPWPATPIEDNFDGTPAQVNGAINMTWNPYDIPEQYPFTEVQSPGVEIVYYGGHSYEVSTQEAADLTAAGFGAYVS